MIRCSFLQAGAAQYIVPPSSADKALGRQSSKFHAQPRSKNTKSFHQNALWNKNIRAARPRHNTKKNQIVFLQVFFHLSPTQPISPRCQQSQAHHSPPSSPKTGTTSAQVTESSNPTSRDASRCPSDRFPTIFPPATLPKGSARGSK